MSDVAITVDHVYKKFTRGERHDSLRDLLPALAKRTFRSIVSAPALRPEEFWALNDLSFEVRKGEALGIIGHNGAGKSTLLKHLSGLMAPTKGNIKINGRLSALIEVGAGFHQDLTGRENIFLNGVILGMSREEIRRKLDEIVEFSGLEPFIDTPVKRYSSGMYARLGFSVAAHMEPDVLIIDEVLSVGDIVFQAKGVEKMRSVVKSGATVLFVSHNLRSMSDLCSRSLLLKGGQLVQDSTTSQVIHTYMEQIKIQRQSLEDKPVVIEDVAIRGVDGPRLDFEPGDKAFIDIKIRANKAVEKVACVLYINDDKYYEIFNTSSERLLLPPITLAAGETRICRFELAMHLGIGNFNVCTGLYRYDTEQWLDNLENCATLIVHSDTDVRGAANLYPKVTILPA